MNLENLEVNLFPVAVILGILNIRTLWLMWRDKRIAKKNEVSEKKRRRIPEKSLLWSAFLFGSVGMWLGMNRFRHKIQKNKFRFGVPFAFLLQIGLVYFLTDYFAIQYTWSTYKLF